MTTNNKRLTAAISGLVLVAAAGGFTVARWTQHAPVAAPVEATKAEPKSGADGKLTLTPQTVSDLGIVTEQVRSGDFNSELIVHASVKAAPSGEALITARASGTVTRVMKRLGDAIRAGEPLAIVESRDAAQIAADRTAASARAALAEKNLARERYLYQQKVSAKIDVERAQAEAASAVAEAHRAQVAASAANVSADGRSVIVRSPITGRVTAEAAALGTFVQPETELFRIADPRLIQVEASIAPADAQRISAGDLAVVELRDGRTVTGKVRSITPTLDGETRSATALIEVSDTELQPGLSLMVRIKPRRAEATNVIVLPEEAIQTVEGRDVVFVRTATGFQTRMVTVGQRSAGRAEILSGIQSGDTVAVRQAFLLKAELSKGSGEEE